MFLHWLNNETGSQQMGERYQLFVQDAHNNYTAEPAPLGHPCPSGATYFFMIYQPDMMMWLQAFTFKLFREDPFLPAHIDDWQSELYNEHQNPA